MLKDELLEFCQHEFELSSAGHCGENCDNCENCSHDCNSCLDQVHWYPQYGGRSDYGCPNLLLAYVLRFSEKYSQQIRHALSFIDTTMYPFFNIFSIGCGATPDLMAFEEIANRKNIYYRGFDRNELWEIIHTQIKSYALASPNLRVNLTCADIFDILTPEASATTEYNVITIQYLLSHLFNIGQQAQIDWLFDQIIHCIINRSNPQIPFLIIITDIDSCYKGRNTWFPLLDKLESAGYSGHAIAQSAYSTGDLGQDRWSHHKQSNCLGNITYEYRHSNEHDCAQLIIELR